MEGYTVQDFLNNLEYMKGERTPGGTSGFDVDDFVAPDILSPRRPDNSARIEQIARRLAEIREEKKALDTEKSMAEYKYLYDADPSAYMGLMQNRKNAEQTEQIRKGSEEATRQANLQSAYKENTNSLMVARYDLSEAENAYRQAMSSGDPEAAEKAHISLNRAKANYDRLDKENGVIRERVMKAFGLTQENPGEAQGGAREPANDSKGDSSHAEAMQGLRDFQGAVLAIDELKNRVKPDNMPISKEAKRKAVADWTAEISRLRGIIDGSKVGQQAKSEACTKLDQLEEQVRNFGKPVGKGGQPSKVTREDYQKALDGMLTMMQLVKKPIKWLQAAKAAGATHPKLDMAIQRLAGKGAL